MDNIGFTLRFVLAVLATWRVSHLLVAEDGPGEIIVHIRAKLGNSFAGKLMDCFYCLSVWVAVPAALFVTRHPVDWLMAWLAVTGAACLLERATQKPESVQPVYELPPGGNDHVLRSETSPTGGDFAGLEPAKIAGPFGRSPSAGVNQLEGSDRDRASDAAHLVSTIDWDSASASAPAPSDDAHPDRYR